MIRTVQTHTNVLTKRSFFYADERVASVPVTFDLGGRSSNVGYILYFAQPFTKFIFTIGWSTHKTVIFPNFVTATFANK